MNNPQPQANSLNVLFVCMGNICRSPAAEGIFRKLVDAAGLSGRIQCDSAGTIGFHSRQSPDRRMRASAERRGYDLTSLSRQIQSHDFNAFDHIIAMDWENHADITRMASAGSKAKISMMCDFSREHSEREVPDPYYGGQRGFDHVLDLLEDACDGLLKHIQSELDG